MLAYQKELNATITYAMKFTSMYTSYLVRLWQEQQAGGEGKLPAWQGEVLHIQSGSKISFQDMDRLFHFFREQLERDGDFER
jgi:hypothetical protein